MKVLSEGDNGGRAVARLVPRRQSPPKPPPEPSEAEACAETCREYGTLTGKTQDEILWEFSEFKGRRLVRLETAPLGWLKVTHDRIRAALMEERQKASRVARGGEDALARINRQEAERAARAAKGGVA